MDLALQPPIPPMEALSVDDIPSGANWQYEPKWDGFRCLAFRDGAEVFLQSKSGQPLARYFPDVVAELQSVSAKRCVLDGEIAIPIGDRFSFDELLMRIHPAESRVRKLAAQHPARFILFDLLLNERGTSVMEKPLHERRTRLDAFARKYLKSRNGIALSPATTDLDLAKKWFEAVGGNLDGIVAKRLDLPYRSGERDGMQKIKRHRTADCVVGGFRFAKGKRVVGSLLLGLYDDAGLLNHIGFTSSFTADERKKVTERVLPLRGGAGFSGRAPGGPSRWSKRESDDWVPLDPKLVIEVEYDHFTGGRFRHGAHLVRWRPDKSPRQCKMEQVEQSAGATLKLLDTSP